MNFRKLGCLFVLSALSSFCQTPSGGKVIHDKTGACQLTVPADWTISAQIPWTAQAPSDQGDVQLVSQPGKTVKPMSDMAQKAMMVAKMIQNTPQSVAYASQPTKGANPITPYHAVAPGKDGTCVALLSARAGLTDEAVKKIVATLSAAH